MIFDEPKIKRTKNGSISKISKTMKKTGYVEVGVINPTKHKDSELTTAQVAAYNEFGTDKIPERSFLRSTMKDQRKQISALSKDILKKIVNGKITPRTGLGILGEVLQNEVKKKIVDIDTPPNAPATIAHKESSNPLIDKGQLRNSILYEVKSGSIK